MMLVVFGVRRLGLMVIANSESCVCAYVSGVAFFMYLGFVLVVGGGMCVEGVRLLLMWCVEMCFKGAWKLLRVFRY